MDNPENPAPQGTQDEEVAIKNGKSREPGTTGHTRRSWEFFKVTYKEFIEKWPFIKKTLNKSMKNKEKQQN